MIDHNHFICHFIFGGHLLNIPKEGSSELQKRPYGEYSCYFLQSALKSQ